LPRDRAGGNERQWQSGGAVDHAGIIDEGRGVRHGW